MTLLATLGDLVPLVNPAKVGLLSDIYVPAMVAVVTVVIMSAVMPIVVLIVGVVPGAIFLVMSVVNAMGGWRSYPMTSCPVAIFRWASETRAVGLPALAALERLGWRRVRRHPRWPDSWLMTRPVAARRPRGGARGA